MSHSVSIVLVALRAPSPISFILLFWADIYIIIIILIKYLAYD